MPETLQCVVVTAEKAVLDEPADFVALPMYDGELGVLPGRAALIGRLGYGELRVQSGATTKKFFVDGGFAQVRANTVTVLTERAFPAQEVTMDTAHREMQAAQEPAATPEEQESRLKRQSRAYALMRMARQNVQE